MRRIQTPAAVFFLFLSFAFPAHAAATVVARDGKALLSVIVSKKASLRVRKAAENLASYLGKITGARFQVVAGKRQCGIAVGLPNHFPDAPFPAKWKKPSSTQRENYILHSHANGIHILGATELAVEHAVWDLLYRIGYRQFFPGKTWEVIPKIRNLSIEVDAREAPAYYSRRIWYGFGPWDYAREPYADWCAKNRTVQGLQLRTGHSYGGIIRQNQKEFDKHPEYYALVNGKRRTNFLGQLCLSNTDLRQLIVRHALRHFKENPDADSMSLDPNDGGGWCECDKCKRMGSVSDRVLTLANEAADAVNEKFGEKYIGIYAYASHSPPPKVRVHPKVVVSVATAFIRGGYTLDELISGWSKRGATLGVREYYSVHTWDRDMPGRSRGSNLDYLKRTIPEFHSKGARFMSAESSDNWGPNGLGYYLAARMLWNVKEAKRADAIIEDFLTRAFGKAKDPMREFYQLIDGSQAHLDFNDQLGRMFRCLERAQKLADCPEVAARIHDLILYAHYVDLFDRYRQAQGKQRQAKFEQVIKHGYRMRRTMMIHTKALYRDVARRDKKVSIPKGATWNVAEAKNPWKSSKPFTADELQSFVRDGIKRHPLVKLDFQMREFSEKLVPAPHLPSQQAKPGMSVRGRATQTFYTWVEKAPSTLQLKITGGLIAHYRDRGNVRVDVWKLRDEGTHVAQDRSVPPDGKERTVTLKLNETGAYKITIRDGGDMTQVKWTNSTPMTFKSSRTEPLKIIGRWTLFFYVPRGVRKIGLFGGPQAHIINPQGKRIYSINCKKPTYHSIAVPPGQDGKLWKIHQANGSIRLLNVPPYLARSGAELLLPAEVVDKKVE